MPKILGWRRPGKIGRCRHFSIYLNLGKQKARKTAEWERQKRAKRFAKAQGCLPFYYIWPVGQAVKTAASHAANRSSILLRVTIYALLAQLVEQLTLNQRAPGSSPWKCTKRKTMRRKFRRFFLLTYALEARTPSARWCGSRVCGAERRQWRRKRSGALGSAAEQCRAAMRHGTTG